MALISSPQQHGTGLREWIKSRPELGALTAFLLVYLSWLALRWIPGGARHLQIVFLAPIDALVVYAAWRASRRCAASPPLRSFWLFVMLGWSAELVADLLLAVYDIGFDDPTFPSVADLFFLAFYPLLLLALLRVPTVRGTRSQRLRIALDCATIVVGGGAVVWYFVLGPTVTEGGQALLATVVSIAYPVGDLVLLGALATVLMRRSPEALRVPLRLIVAGLLMLIAADTIYGQGQLHGTYSPGDPVDTLYVLMAVPFVLAAASQRLLRPGDPDGEVGGSAEPSLRASRLPLLGMAVGFGILLGTQWQDKFFPDLSLLFVAIAVAALVAIRQHVAQRELVQLQGRVRTIVESVAEGIVTFSEAGRIIWANPAAEETFMVRPGGLEGEQVDVLFDGVGWREIAPVVGVGAGSDDSAIGERRKLMGRRRDGTTFPLELVVTDAQMDDERVLIGIGQDVGERARVESALRESERRFRGIFDNAGVGIAFSSFESGEPRIVDVNPAFARMVGYSVEELRGESFSLITPPEGRSDLAEVTEAVRADQDYIAREQRCMRKDGSTMWGSLTVTILRDDSGAPRFGIGMLEDITRRKKAEKVKDEFVSVVGHELRTPLTSIRGSLGLLEGGVLGDLPEDAAHMLTTAVSNTDRLVRLINDILDIERIDSGRADLDLAPTSTAELVDQSIQVIQSVADEASVTIRTAVEDVTVAADADRMVQTLTNLIGNAIKFSDRGGTVSVAVEQDRSRAVFSVSDTGRGIPKDQLEAIFERFSQVDSSDAREKGGTGLGLAIARSIVEHHGGRIWAESPEGEGATFRLTLPVAYGGVGVVVCGEDNGGQRLEALREMIEEGGPGAILVVEDDPALGDVMTETLAGVDVPTNLVRTVDEAVDAIRLAPPKVVVLDLVLPGEDGYAIVDRLRGEKALADAHLIIYTALDLSAADRERLQLGHTEFYFKSHTTPAEVERRIAELLHESDGGPE